MAVRLPRPPRDLRLARLPLLLAYLLVLLGTPVGEAGFLWMHLTTAHAGPARPSEHPVRSQLGQDEPIAATGLERGHDKLPAHEHAHAAGHAHEHPAPHEDEHRAADVPEHHAPAAIADIQPDGRSVALDQPHEHGGRVHTHHQQPVPDAALLNGALSKHYLSPSTISAPSPGADARQARAALPAPHQVAARIDTPPPRLPG